MRRFVSNFYIIFIDIVCFFFLPAFLSASFFVLHPFGSLSEMLTDVQTETRTDRHYYRDFEDASIKNGGQDDNTKEC